MASLRRKFGLVNDPMFGRTDTPLDPGVLLTVGRGSEPARYCATLRRSGADASVTITPTETPRLANRAERRVDQALIEQLEPNDLVVSGQRVTSHLKDHEADFVVGIEGAHPQHC